MGNCLLSASAFFCSTPKVNGHSCGLALKSAGKWTVLPSSSSQQSGPMVTSHPTKLTVHPVYLTIHFLTTGEWSVLMPRHLCTNRFVTQKVSLQALSSLLAKILWSWDMASVCCHKEKCVCFEIGHIGVRVEGVAVAQSLRWYMWNDSRYSNDQLTVSLTWWQSNWQSGVTMFVVNNWSCFT